LKRQERGLLFNAWNSLTLGVVSLLCVYPLVFCLFASFSEPELIDRYRGILWRPFGFSFASYQLVFMDRTILNGFLYTIALVVVGTSINLLLTSFAAYPLSRRSVYWKRPLTLFILFTMYFSGGLIPSYIIVADKLALRNTMWALLLPGAISTFYMIIMRTYFSGIPDSLEESASIDGASHFTILFRIILPTSLPIVAVMIIYYGVQHWNGWFNAMIYLTNSRKWRPLQLILRDILILNDTSQQAVIRDTMAVDMAKRLVKYALIIVTTMPIIFIYPFLQRYFIGGIMIGSLKG
jgi:putative aldouronate transport system permease protein